MSDSRLARVWTVLLAGLLLANVDGVAANAPESAGRRGPLLLRLVLDQAVYAPGQRVRFVVTLTNTGTSEVSIELPTSQASDVAVLQNDRVIWRWSAGRAFLQVLTRLRLEPGETRTFPVEWDQRDVQERAVPSGMYAAQARLTAREPLLTDRLPFRIGQAGDLGTLPAVMARAVERSGVSLGEVVVNGTVVLRMRDAAGGLSPVRRAEIIAGRLEVLLRQGLRPEALRVGTVAGEAAVLWQGRLVVTADARHARLNGTTPVALARLWREQMARALST